MAAPPETIQICSNCEAAVTGAPEFHVGLAFCCAGCVVGGPCVCSYDEPALAPIATTRLQRRSTQAPARLSSPAWTTHQRPDGPSPLRRSSSSATVLTRSS